VTQNTPTNREWCFDLPLSLYQIICLQYGSIQCSFNMNTPYALHRQCTGVYKQRKYGVTQSGGEKHDGQM